MKIIANAIKIQTLEYIVKLHPLDIVFYQEIIDLILRGKINNKTELHKAKIAFCKKHKINDVPSDSEILADLPQSLSVIDHKKIISVLRRKPMRTISGVAVVAVMTSPSTCPHGRCTPCPGGPKKDSPQSYTGFEPAAMRAKINNFDPFSQVINRVRQLEAIGHPVDKVDLIIMGGTFNARRPFYQKWFVKGCYDGLNGFKSRCLNEAKKLNEKAEHRCIGLTIETRPDWFRLQHADMALEMGATRVELGVQTVSDDILQKIKRGHTVKDTVLATRTARESGFKICYHLMPGLPGSSIEKDLRCFQTIFENNDFKPDMIKIYPTLTIKDTELYDMWKKGEYTPLTTEEAARLIAHVKNIVPRWVRIQRIQRDVPAQHIDAGVNKSNLRQIVQKEMIKLNYKCSCIRCREIGHKKTWGKIDVKDENIVFENIYGDRFGRFQFDLCFQSNLC